MPDDSIAPPDRVLSALYKVQVHFATFRQLTGVDDPWQLTKGKIQKCRELMGREDRIVRGQHPGEDITCVAWTDGAHWLLPEGVKNYSKTVETAQRSDNGLLVQPVWRMTLREMLSQHFANLRQLVLSIAYDLVTIDNLKEQLPSDHIMLKKEFQRCEQVVSDLIQELMDERDRLGKVLTNNVELYERIIITERMIQSGETTEAILGYSVNDLKAAQEHVRDLCQRELSVYEHVLNLTRGRVQEGLRGGEQTQLTRTSRWDYAIHQFEEPPEGMVGLASLMSFERKRLSAIVRSREEELGPTEEGQEVLAQAESVEQPPAPEPEAPPEPKVEEPKEETPQEKEARKEREAKRKLVRRMAAAERRERR